MNYDLRYDGPDMEAEASNRQANVLMGATMMLDALSGARQSRTQATATQTAAQQAEALHADQAVWRDTPAGAELAGVDDSALAHRWVACAAHPDQPDANEARSRLEAELARRDPETMRDYRSWRHAAGLAPGEAMHKALTEREARLWQAWKPLTGPGIDTMPAAEVLTRWAAAHTAHGHHGIAEDLEKARIAGGRRLKEVDPARVDAWTALQAAQPSPVQGLGSRPGLSPADAAARTAAHPAAFLPGPGGSTAGWGAVATHGVKVATTMAAHATPAAPVVAGAQLAASAARHAHHALSRGMRP